MTWTKLFLNSHIDQSCLMMKMDLEDWREFYQLLFDLNKEPTVHFHHDRHVWLFFFLSIYRCTQGVDERPIRWSLHQQTQRTASLVQLLLTDICEQSTSPATLELCVFGHNPCTRIWNMVIDTAAKVRPHVLQWQMSVIIRNSLTKQLSKSHNQSVFTSCIVLYCIYHCSFYYVPPCAIL